MSKELYEFITAQTGENIVERKTCPNCGQEFAITDKDLEFYDKISPVFNGTKYEIPAPTLCPDCRQQRRLAWRNERKLYKRKCDLTWKNIISIYSPDSKYKVFDQKEWRSDKWNPLDYGRDFDFSKSFFEQFNEFLKNIPLPSLITFWNNINSEYCNYIMWLKNCYLEFWSLDCEDCMYGHNNWYSKNIIDSYFSQWEYLYEGILSSKIYNSCYIYFSENISESEFIYNSNNLSNCFMCCNLNNKSFCILNKQYTKEEYHQKIKEINLWNKFNNYKYIAEFNKFVLKFFRKNLEIINCDNCSWNHLSNCKNCKNSFYMTFWLNIDNSFCYESFDIQNSFDVTNSWWSSLIYEWYNYINSSKSTYSYHLDNCNNVLYSQYSLNSSNLFGCVWLRNKQYCIFNKQYTKEEYEILVPKIIEHMKITWERWEFFPASISPFGYNETSANEYYPMDKDEAQKQWYKRQNKEYPINVPEWIKLIRAQDLPEDINDVDDEILKKAVICEISWKPFRIVKAELDFYRKHNLPLPRKHPDVRHLERIQNRWGRKLHLKKCDNCNKKIITIYPEKCEFKVYCEDCYNKQTY